MEGGWLPLCLRREQGGGKGGTLPFLLARLPRSVGVEWQRADRGAGSGFVATHLKTEVSG